MFKVIKPKHRDAIVPGEIAASVQRPHGGLCIELRFCQTKQEDPRWQNIGTCIQAAYDLQELPFAIRFGPGVEARSGSESLTQFIKKNEAALDALFGEKFFKALWAEFMRYSYQTESGLKEVLHFELDDFHDLWIIVGGYAAFVLDQPFSSSRVRKELEAGVDAWHTDPEFDYGRRGTLSGASNPGRPVSPQTDLPPAIASLIVPKSQAFPDDEDDRPTEPLDDEELERRLAAGENRPSQAA